LIYREYQDYLQKNSLYDFSDMINFTVEALEKDEDLRYDLAEKFQYIMLDEYQDTNNSQNKLIDLILSPLSPALSPNGRKGESGANIMVV
jgi:DNA helicase-2/ATP-dependent DNA helicase PcrA